MIIRPYKPTDRQACIEIFNSNIPAFFALEELDGFESWLNSKDLAQLAFESNQTEFYYVIEIENRIVGCGGFYIPQNGGEARMTWGMVEKLWHKKGIGRKFLEYRIEQIRLLNPNVGIALDTTQNTFRFFEKFGFKVTKIQNDYYAKGLDRYDMVQERNVNL